MSVVLTYNQMNRHVVDRVKTWGDHWHHLLPVAVQRIVLLVTITDRDLIVPFTALERLGLHVEVAFRAFAP